jgi:mannose-6-phosphate isomerase
MAEQSLYPLKFTPIVKDKIWGGTKLKTLLNKNSSDTAGESWEISGVENDVSVVSNGFLQENTLQELIEIYMGDLVGEKVYEKFGNEFPLLIKFIDATDDLSIQVHPDDELAAERHDSFGKTEMWYVMQADEGAKMIVGFNQEVNKELYKQKVDNNTLTDILNIDEVSEGDVYFLPAKRVHAIGSGNLIAEIQQTSDITYRIYDFNRKDKDGNTRELHTELAVDSIDYNYYPEYKTKYQSKLNSDTELVSCEYFTTNLLEFDTSFEKELVKIDSFVIYMCLEGKLTIEFEGGTETFEKGDTILIPNQIESLKFKNSGKCKLLEVYIK